MKFLLLLSGYLLSTAQVEAHTRSTLRAHVERELQKNAKTTAVTADTSRPSTSSDSSFQGQCMQDNYRKYMGKDQNLVCAAKEVTLVDGTITAKLPIDTATGKTQDTCKMGDKVKILSISSEVKFNAARYDPGWYIATDGGDALTGNCTIQPLMKGGSYTMKSGPAINWDDDFKGGKDQCGDITGAALLQGVELLKNTEILCDSTRADGKLEFSICFSWRVAGSDDMCDPRALYPGTVAKCNCDKHFLNEVTVVKPIALKKTTASPTSSPTLKPTAKPTSSPTLKPTAKPTSSPTLKPTASPTSSPIVPTAPRNGQKLCLEEASGQDETCVGGNMEIESINSSTYGSCQIGENITVSLQANIRVKSEAAMIIDPSWHIGADGGYALTGTCHVAALTSVNNYNLSDGGTVSYDVDACGDIDLSRTKTKSTLLTNVNLLVEQEVTCADEDQDGSLDLSICLSWKSQSGSKCDPSDPVTGKVECYCARYDIPNISVLSTLDDAAVPRC